MNERIQSDPVSAAVDVDKLGGFVVGVSGHVGSGSWVGDERSDCVLHAVFHDSASDDVDGALSITLCWRRLLKAFDTVGIFMRCC